MALVLSYEAPNAVANCARALHLQTVRPAQICVIDNAGRQRADAALGDLAKGIRVDRLDRNRGPAGGHAAGLRRFLASGCTYAWVMDDDCIPAPTALGALLKHAANNPSRVVFPTVVDEQGKRADYPGWLGVLIPRQVVASVGVPREELFWWAEDTDYLQWRIPRAGFEVVRSPSAHLTVTRGRVTRAKPAWKYYYEARNTVYHRIHTQWRSLGWHRLDRPVLAARSAAKLATRAIVIEESRRSSCLAMVARGLLDGLRGRLGVRFDVCDGDRPVSRIPARVESVVATDDAASRVDVILPTYNRRQMLPRALDSVLNQEHHNISVTVVDDGSTDGTQEYLATIDDPRLRVIALDRNQGPSVARNIGLDSTDAPFVAFMDSDDWWYPTKLQEQVAVLANGPATVGAATCGAEFVRQGAVERVWTPGRSGSILHDLLQQRHVSVGPPFLLFRRAAINALNLRFDPQLPAWEDYDFALKFFSHADIAGVGKVLLRVHHHDGPRAWTSRRAIEAGEILLSEHEALFRADRRGAALMRLRIAQSCIALEEIDRATHQYELAAPQIGYLLRAAWYATLWLYRASSTPPALRRLVRSISVRLSFGR